MSSIVARGLSPLPILKLPAFLSALLDRPFTHTERSWLYRSALAPLVALQWNSFISEFYRRCGQNPPSTPILRKPLVEYAMAGLSPTARMHLLLTHYSLLAHRFRSDFIQDLCSGRRTSLAALTSKGEEFEIFIASSDQVSTTGEGEIVFALLQTAQQQIICKLTMFFALTESEPVLVIGGVRSSAGYKPILTAATRKLEGLRPKDVLLLSARSFAAATGFRELHAICNDRHVEKSGGKLFANFDEYWIERGAAAGGPYGFILTAAPPPMVGETRRDILKRQIVDDVGTAASQLCSRDPVNETAA
jgi:uncharacterized protein VirK/YbjX